MCVGGGLCVSYNLKDIMTHPDSLALMKQIMGFLVLVRAKTKTNYTHLHDLDAFFARPQHSVDPCHVTAEFSPRPVHFKLILISWLLCLRLSTDSPLPFRFSTQLLYAFGFCPVRATFSTHLILLDFVTLIIFSRKQIWRSSSFYNFFSASHHFLSLMSLSFSAAGS